MYSIRGTKGGLCLVNSELIEGNGYEGRLTSKVLNNRRSYNLKVPIT